jgi:hypothetical protein
MTSAAQAHGGSVDFHVTGPPGSAWAPRLKVIYITDMTGNNIHARSGPPRPGPTLSLSARRGAPSGGPGEPPARQGARAVGRGRKGYAAAGAAAAAVPAVPGVAFAAAGHPAGLPLLICGGLIGLVSIIANAAVKIYDSAQQTRRLELQHAGTTAIAEAMARCIDEAHALRDVPAPQRAAEAISARTSAMQLATQMMSAMLAVIGQQNTAPDDVGTQRAGQNGHRDP